MFLSPVDIEIYNATNRGWYASSLAYTLLPYGFQIDLTTWLHSLREKVFEKSIIHYNNIDANDVTLQELKTFLTVEAEENNELFEAGERGIKIILADFETF